MKINKEIAKEYPWNTKWDRRSKILSMAIPEGISVIDLGGGMGTLDKYLKNCAYKSIDLKKWTDETVVADFNKGEFPDIDNATFQMIVCQGVIEYITDPELFLIKIKKYGRNLLITYRQVRADENKHLYKNNLNNDEFMEMLRLAGWDILFSRTIASSQKLFYCSKKDDARDNN